VKYSLSDTHLDRTANHYELARIPGSRHAGQVRAGYNLASDARSGLTALVFAFLAWALLATGVAAHAVMVQSDPESGEVREQAPEQVVAWFSQEVDARLSTMQVFDAEGRQVDEGDGGVDLNDPDHKSMTVSLPEALPDSVYTVRWAAVSAADDDTTEGEFAFVVGNGAVTEAPAPVPDTETGFNLGLVIGAGVAVLGFLLLVLLFARRRAAD
jgi:methionine-rich copper-binding protein CopC